MCVWVRPQKHSSSVKRAEITNEPMSVMLELMINISSVVDVTVVAVVASGAVATDAVVGAVADVVVICVCCAVVAIVAAVAAVVPAAAVVIEAEGVANAAVAYTFPDESQWAIPAILNGISPALPSSKARDG